ncbi:MAG: hypothetical protein ACP5G5_05455 [Thermoplasmata archaeon]|jgi:hypothetical protein|nr:hypothetical protein [Thermoplasmatales archaeon]PMP74911.1 MAG: hypothetical protein C0180_02925 [Aciduliprofundum sp.]HEU12636.1 hypothetical protein [Euryarchaeota archaeon]
MKRLVVFISVFIILISFLAFSSGQNEVTYPSITIHFLNGTNSTITDSIWKQLVFPILFSKTISKYNWSNDPQAKYVFFTYDLAGLNPFGVQFVFALEKYTNVSFYSVTQALLYVRNLPSTHPGYTNGELLDMGVLPGFPNSPIKSQQVPFYLSLPFIVLIILIASVFIMYYVFNKI